MKRQAVLYIQGEEVIGELESTDEKTYTIKAHVFTMVTGRYEGEKVLIFENGDKFKEWLQPF